MFNQQKVEIMKLFKKSILAVLALGLMLFGCKPDTVDPAGKTKSSDKTVAGAFDDLHPTLDTICQLSDSIFFQGADGSWYVNKCVSEDWFSPVVLPCIGDQPKWGYFFVYNGYQYTTTDTVHWLDVDFTLAPGIFCDLSSWLFTTGNGITVDPNTGFPNVAQDWSNAVSNPVRNQWKVQIRVDELPLPTFDLACRMSVLRLSFFGDEVIDTRTNLWAKNHLWNVEGSEYASNNEFVLRYTPFGCLEMTPPPAECPAVQASSVCEVVYTGLANCTTNNTMSTTSLAADSSGTSGHPVYTWSNGATTSNINVSPTANTSYTVTVSDGTCNIRVVTFNVTAIDASCAIPGTNSNNGSGGSGSSHRPGCNHSHSHTASCNGGAHKYGCNASHSGGTSNCNRKGHGYHCTGTHPTNRACNGGHSRGCDGQHSSSSTCQSRGGHKYNCNGQHTSGNCTSNLSHTSGCSSSNHSSYRGCNNGHSHHGHGNGSGYGSGYNGGHGHSHNCGGTPPSTPGVKVCHVPPGNPNGAATVCVPVSQVSQHVTGVCSSNGGNNGSNNGSNHYGGGGGCNNGYSGQNGPAHYSGNHGGCTHGGNHGPSHNSGNHTNCTHGGTNGNGHSSNNHSQCSHGGKSGNGHNSGNHSQCSHGGKRSSSNGGSGGCGGRSNHSGGRTGCGTGNSSNGHSNDKIGACNSNPCS